MNTPILKYNGVSVPKIDGVIPRSKTIKMLNKNPLYYEINMEPQKTYIEESNRAVGPVRKEVPKQTVLTNKMYNSGNNLYGGLEMVTAYVPRNPGRAFTDRVDFTSHESANSPGYAIINNAVCFNATWVDLILTVSEAEVDIVTTTDYTGTANVATWDATLNPSADPQHVWVLLHGVPASTSLAYGSDTFTVKAVSHIPDTPGDVSGYYVLYGERPV